MTATNNLTIASSIEEGGVATALTVSGASRWTLSGNNTYAGPTTVLGGTLVVSSDANLGGRPIISLNNGINSLMAAGSFSSNKGFTKRNGGGQVNTAGFNLSFAGPNMPSLSKTGLGHTYADQTLSLEVTPLPRRKTLALPNAASGSVSGSSVARCKLPSRGYPFLLPVPVSTDLQHKSLISAARGQR